MDSTPESLLRSHGLQVTAQRLAVLLAVWGRPHCTAENVADDVRAEIRHRVETIGAGGGLILGPTHHVQLDTPLENFWAMIETIRDTTY